jgi:hypothetical protein
MTATLTLAAVMETRTALEFETASAGAKMRSLTKKYDGPA